jgi:mono/diheme cytochrome c family protein
MIDRAGAEHPQLRIRMKLLGKIIGGLLVVIVLLVGAAYLASASTVGKRFTITDPSPPIPTDSASIERGRHFARAITKCVACHGDDLGGEVMVDNMLLGRVASVNLTRGKGGLGNSLTDPQIVTAIRHGVGGDGRALFIMPSAMYQQLSDDDVAVIAAYVRSVPPVDRAEPVSRLGPLGRVLLATGKMNGIQEAFEIDHTARRRIAPTAGPTAEYGGYLVTVSGCKLCHGPTLSGGEIQGPPSPVPASNITPEGLKAYDEASFFRALREGKRPSGTPINPVMPWKLTREMNDVEIRAVWSYLHTIPSKPFGNH